MSTHTSEASNLSDRNAQEKMPGLPLILEEFGLEMIPGCDDQLQWCQNCKQHPRNWTTTKKAYNVTFIVLYEAFEAAMSSVGASAAIQAREQLDISPTVGYLALTTTFVVAEGIAGLVFPPLSEAFGRKWQYVFSAFFFCIFNVLSAVPYLPAIIVFRFLAGLVGGVPPCISPGSLEDLFDSKKRIWSIFAWATASNVGLVLGPVISSYVTNTLGWQWTFYLAGITSSAVFIMSLFFSESRPNVLLKRRLRSVRKASGISSLTVYSNNEDSQSLRFFLRDTLSRPLHLLATEPIILISSSMNGFAFAFIYALTEALPLIYQSFGFRLADTSLAFLAVLLGVVLSILLRVYNHKRMITLSKNGQGTEPEQSLGSLPISAPLLCVGLWVFAWTIPPQVLGVNFVVSMIALVPVGLAANDFDAVFAIYLVDVYGSFAASAFASVTWIRALASLTFTLATDKMVRELGANVASSIFASGALLICMGALMLWKFGATLRRRSSFALSNPSQATEFTVNCL